MLDLILEFGAFLFFFFGNSTDFGCFLLGIFGHKCTVVAVGLSNVDILSSF